jgi:hypothetical protein
MRAGHGPSADDVGDVPSLMPITLSVGGSRHDLAVPGHLPVVDLVPELARRFDLLAAGPAHRGYRLVTPVGRALAPDRGLAEQQVDEGAILCLTGVADPGPGPRFDDVAEAVGAVVTHHAQGLEAASTRRTAGLTAVLALSLAGLLLVSVLAARSVRIGAPVAVVVTMVVLVLVGQDLVRWLLGARVARLEGVPLEASGVDLAQVRAQVRAGHELLCAATGATGLLLVLAAPAAVSCGPAGAVLMVAASVSVMLRGRGQAAPLVRSSAVGAGVAGLLATFGSALWWQDAWRPVVVSAALLALPGAVVVLAASRRAPAVAGRAGDLAEGMLVVALPPMVVLASGILERVGR